MKEEGLLKQSLKLAFSREVVLFALVCTGVTVAINLLCQSGVYIGYIGIILQLAFYVVFGMYIFNLSLAKALSKYFNVGQIPIISANPQIGKKPAVIFCWALIIVLFIIAIVVLAAIFSTGLAKSVPPKYKSTVIEVMAICLTVGTFLAMWFFVIPFLAGKVFEEDRTQDFMAKDFKEKYDKKYFLIYLVGFLIISLAVLLIALMSGVVVIAVTLGNYDKVVASAFGIIVGIPFNVVNWIASAACLIYAYLSWLQKADLETVGFFYNLPLKVQYKEEEALEEKNEVNKQNQIKEGTVENGNTN